MDVNEELSFCENSKKKKLGKGGWGGRVWGGGQGGCERRIEVFGKIKKKKIGGRGSGGGGGGGGGGFGLGVSQGVDVNEELKFLGKLKKKLGGGGLGEGRVRLGASGWMLTKN